MQKALLTLTVSLMFAATGTAVRAGTMPIVVRATAEAGGFINAGSPSYFDNDAAFSVAATPATAARSLTGVTSNASATFTELRAFSRNDLVSDSRAWSVARAEDTLTIQPLGNPTGSTRLELTWQVEGSLSGDGAKSAGLNSAYRPDTAGPGQPTIGLSPHPYFTNGTFNDLLTLLIPRN